MTWPRVRCAGFGSPASRFWNCTCVRTTRGRRSLESRSLGSPFRNGPTARSPADNAMAKAILGHTRGPVPRVLYEMHRLRQRVRDLEAELVRLRADNAALTTKAKQDVV